MKNFPDTLRKNLQRVTITALALIVISQVGFAKPKSPTKNTDILPPKLNLEERVWLAAEDQLPAIEREVVRTMQINPHSVKAHYLLAHTMVRLFATDPGDLQLLKQASDLAQQALDLDPTSDYGYVAMADILDLMGNPDRALALLNDAETAGLAPSWRFYFTRARLSSDEAQTEKILGFLETAMAFTDSQTRIIAPYVVAVLQSDKNDDKLVSNLKQWNEKFPTSIFELTLAITESEQGRYQEANAHYDKILAREPFNKEAYINKGILLYRNLKKPAEAVKIFSEVLNDPSFKPTNSIRSTVHAHLGSTYLALKKYPEAGKAFQHAMEDDPQNLGMLDFINKAYQAVGSVQEFANLMEGLKETIPATGALYALLGETLSMKLGQHEKALNAFSDAIVLEPSRSDYYNAMGLAFYRMKNYPEALKLFTSATDIDPSDASAQYNEACALSLLGRGEEALAKLSEAISIDPRLADSAKADSDFAPLKANSRFQDLVLGDMVGGAEEVYGH
jgi:tetratricopeptide (TPR) repeat protein